MSQPWRVLNFLLLCWRQWLARAGTVPWAPLWALLKGSCRAGSLRFTWDLCSDAAISQQLSPAFSGCRRFCEASPPAGLLGSGSDDDQGRRGLLSALWGQKESYLTSHCVGTVSSLLRARMVRISSRGRWLGGLWDEWVASFGESEQEKEGWRMGNLNNWTLAPSTNTCLCAHSICIISNQNLIFL